jgi:hypothetical protein
MLGICNVRNLTFDLLKLKSFFFFFFFWDVMGHIRFLFWGGGGGGFFFFFGGGGGGGECVKYIYLDTNFILYIYIYTQFKYLF